MPGRTLSPLLAFLFCSIAVMAADSTTKVAPEIAKNSNVQGESFTYEENGKVLVAMDASVEANGAHLAAKKISFNSETGIIDAEGDVVYTTKNLRIMGERVTMNPKIDLVVAYNVKIGRNPMYFTAEEIRIQNGDRTMKGVRMWNNEPHAYGMNLKINEAHYSDKEDWLTFKGVVPHLAGIPFFYLPYYGQDGYHDIPYDVELSTGSQDAQGRYLRTTTLVRQSKSLWVGALLDYYGKSGFLIGPALRYDNSKTTKDGTVWRGDLKSGYIHDSNALENDIYGRTPDANRGFLIANINGYTTNNFDFAGQFYLTSDPNFIRSFRPREIADIGLPQASFEVTKSLAQGYLSATVIAKADNYQDVAQKLPELRYDLTERVIAGTPFNHRAFVSASYLTERPSAALPLPNFTTETGATEAWSTARYDAYYGITYPLTVRNYLTFKPVVGARATSWSSNLTNTGSVSKAVGQVGFDVEGLATGSWNLKADHWSINGMRHAFRPFIQYRYLPGADHAIGQIPLSERDVAFSAFRELDLADRPDAAANTATQVGRVGFRNTLATRDTEMGTRELARFDITKDWSNADESLGKTDSDIQTHIRLTPANWVTIDSYSRYAKNDGGNVESLQSIAFNSGDFWKASVGWFELKQGADPAKQLWIMGEVKLNSTFSALLTINYDALAKAYTYESIGLIQRIGNSWEIEYGFQKRVSAFNDGSLGAHVRVRLFKF